MKVTFFNGTSSVTVVTAPAIIGAGLTAEQWQQLNTAADDAAAALAAANSAAAVAAGAAPAIHRHDASEIDGLPTGSGPVAWDDVQNKPALAPAVHRHDASEIDNLPAGSGPVAWDEVQNKPLVFAPATHRHNASDIDGLPTGGGSDLPMRSAAEFGVVADDWGQTIGLHDNLTAMQAAIDWSAAEGGHLVLPPGPIHISGTLVMKSYMTMTGAGPRNSVLRQLAVATDDLGSFADVLTVPTVSGSTGGAAYITLRSLGIDGGWTKRDYVGKAGQANWAHDPARLTQRGIYLNTPANGPQADIVRAADSDAHHLLEDVAIMNIAGWGIYASGRGENVMSKLQVCDIGKHAIYMDSPDCWLSDATCYRVGDTGIVYTGASGDTRASNIKAWFCGMQSAAQTVGAGVELVSQGMKSVNFVNFTTQDTWGPGFLLRGAAGIRVQGTVDEPGGGRLEQQGFGWAGARTLARTAIRCDGTLAHSRIIANVLGGGRTATRPYAVHLSGAGINNVHIDLTGELTNYLAPYVLESAGTFNAKRWNTVRFGERLLHGRVTAAMLADAGHAINDATYGPSRVMLDTGQVARRTSAGAWVADSVAAV